MIHRIEAKTTHKKANLKFTHWAIKPTMTGPVRKAAIPTEFIVAKPTPGANPFTLADAAYKIGEANEIPNPTIINPGKTIQGLPDKIIHSIPAITNTPPIRRTTLWVYR